MDGRPYERLIVWKEAHALCLHVFAMTKELPSREKFRIVDQMEKAAYSVPMNIAEGNMRRTAKDKAHFFTIALASLEELHYQSRLIADLGYISVENRNNIQDHMYRVSYLLTKLRKAVLIS